MALYKAQELKKNLKYQEAINELEIVVQKEHQNQQAWQEKSFCENELQQYENAIISCENLLKLNPKNQTGLNNQSFALAKLGRYDEALKILDNCIKLHPNYVHAFNTKAIALIGQEKYDEALKCAEKATQLDQKFKQAWSNKGIALLNLAKYKEALQCFDKALSIDKAYATAWCQKANALNMLGQANEGFKCFQKALQLDPKHKLASKNLSKLSTESIFFKVLSEEEQKQISKNFMECFLQDNSMLWVGKLANLHTTNPSEISLYFKYLQPYTMRQYEVSELKITEPKIVTTSTAQIHFGIYKKQQVAIKEQQLKDENDPMFIQILREAAILSFYQHKNISILKSIHFNANSMDIQLILEKYHLDLETALFGKKPVKLSNKKQIALQILDALIYIHETGMTHNDLKPSNIMFKNAEMKEIVLLNFGNSKISPLTKSFTAVPLSYCYAPPEVSEADHIHVSPLSDIFSFGIILCEIVSGRRSWYRYNSKPMQVYEFVQKKNFNFFIETHNSGVPQIDNVVKICVQVDQSKRPSGKEVKAMLEKINF